MFTCQLTITLFFYFDFIYLIHSVWVYYFNNKKGKIYMIPWHPDDSALLRYIWTIRTEIQIIHTSKHPMTERVHVLDYDIDTYVNVVYNVVTLTLRIWNFRWNINVLIITCIFSLVYQRHIIIYVSGFIEAQVLHMRKIKLKVFLFYGDFPCLTKLIIFTDRTSPSLVDIFLQVFMK